MGSLLQLFIRNGGFVTLVLVEAFCFYVIVRFNDRQKAVYEHSFGRFSGDVLQRRQHLMDYWSLDARVDSLSKENSELQQELANRNAVQVEHRDTFFSIRYDSLFRSDSVRHRVTRPEFFYVSAAVIGNSINGANNWLMLNRGSQDGVEADMAVVTRSGIVGIVREVNLDFALVMSVLHRQTKISAALKRERAFGSLVWEGGDPDIMTLKFIPKHFDKIQVGDTVVTSGYSQMFPHQHMIGIIARKPEQDPENPYFLDMQVRLRQDMSTVQDVYVVKNIFATQIDSLQRTNRDEH
ncbi:MAG: rod shape-determining protein MreC [Saprospiraceae bacterium]